MTTSSFATTQAYQRIGITSEVEAATPHRLIQLMMERVLTKIAMARGHMERKSIAEKGANITSAITVN